MRNLFPVLRRTLLGVSALLAMSSAAHAVVNHYGNLVGPNVTYLGNGTPPDPQGILESTSQVPGPDPATLFGAPGITGDTLQFAPPAFKITSAAGGATQLQDGRLSMGILTNSPPATSGYFINTLNITEGGSFTVAGGTGNASLASLVVNGLFITAVNGAAVNPIPVTLAANGSGLFTSGINSGSSANLNSAATSGGIALSSTGSGAAVSGSWNGSETFNIQAALQAAGFPSTSHATRLSLDLDNTLTGQSATASGLAFIDKKFFNIAAVAVPEPSTIVLAGLGGLGMLVACYRRKKAKA